MIDQNRVSVTMTCDAWMLGVSTGPMCGNRISIGLRDADFRMNLMDPLPALLELARERGWRWRRRGDYQGERMFDYCLEHRNLANEDDDHPSV